MVACEKELDYVRADVGSSTGYEHWGRGRCHCGWRCVGEEELVVGKKMELELVQFYIPKDRLRTFEECSTTINEVE